MKYSYTYFILGLISFLALEVEAKELLTDVTISNNKIVVKDSKLYVDFDIDISEIDLRSNQSIILTPTINRAGRVMNLPEIVLNGRNNQISYNRLVKNERKQPLYSKPYMVMRFRSNSESLIPYTATIPFEEWMEGSTLLLKQDVNLGCKDKVLDVGRMVVEQSVEAPYHFTPMLTYLSVSADALTKEQQSIESFIFFPRGKSEIIVDYKQNRQNIAKIDTLLVNSVINYIRIVGSASPEGIYQSNKELSERRALVLASYLGKHYNVSTKIEKIDWVGENWKSLTTLVQGADMEYKQEVLGIIENVGIFSGREKSLMELKSGAPYRYIDTYLFPKLRRASYVVHFKNKPFDVMAGREQVISNPKLLSVDEMLFVAQSYSVDSPEYKRVIETAIKQYPENVMANINMSSILIGEGEFVKAKKYLEKYKENPASWSNMGVIYMVEGDNKLAYEYLQKSVDRGDVDAINNMKELNRNKKHYVLQLN